MTVLLTLLLVILAIQVYADHKRINQIDRDVTNLFNRTPLENTPEPTPKKETKEVGNLRELLKEAHVKETKAYVAADIATRHGWQILDIQENIKMVRYMRARQGDVQKVNIYHGGKGGRRDLFTVATAINHPVKGKTQLFRKYVSEQELDAVLKNPRAHTDKGYYQGK